jgi:hypothetical protein
MKHFSFTTDTFYLCRIAAEHRTRAFDNRALKKAFGLMGNEITRGQRKLHNEKHYDLKTSPNITVYNLRTMKLSGRVARLGQERCTQSFGDET